MFIQSIPDVKYYIEPHRTPLKKLESLNFGWSCPPSLTGFARLYGYPVGIIGNNGVLFSESALKVIFVLLSTTCWEDW